MKTFLASSIALTGFEFAAQTSPPPFNHVMQNPRWVYVSPNIDLFSIGQVFEETKPVSQSSFAIPRPLHDDPKLIRDYQKSWETRLMSLQPTAMPVFNPTKIEMLRYAGADGI